MQLSDLSLDKVYTYADYLIWTFQERVELLKGYLMPMSAPNTARKKLSFKLSLKIGNFLEHSQCEVFSAPFDVRLPKKNDSDETIYTVVQPDICVICDPSKLDYKGCIGAPDIVIEIVSPSNTYSYVGKKFNIYEEAGVKEYWEIEPLKRTIVIYTLQPDDRFMQNNSLIIDNKLTINVLPGFSLNIIELFDTIKDIKKSGLMVKIQAVFFHIFSPLNCHHLPLHSQAKRKQALLESNLSGITRQPK
ncbi:MAG: Uma2 family endonuclease [Chitinophagia bacterium]|nr:Uma2 family endonuclease [Chitinophagia bacterium]